MGSSGRDVKFLHRPHTPPPRLVVKVDEAFIDRGPVEGAFSEGVVAVADG
jgi:hypothetical protein